MITVPTVLILGAGASYPYGFPLGRQLKDEVVANLSPARNSHHLFVQLGFEPDHISKFRDALRFSGQKSVDAFLEVPRNAERFLALGKVAIAQALIPYEKHEQLFAPFEQPGRAAHPGALGDWYSYLFSSLWLESSFERFDLNQLAVITFNYDRSLEHYLFTVMTNSSGRPEREVAEKLAAIPIYHIYGSLAPLPWQGPGSSRAYEPSAVREAAQHLKILAEGPSSSEIVQDARHWVEKAQRIHILGFGFHRTNVNLLRLGDIPQATLVGIATCMGFEQAEQAHTSRMLGEKWELAHNTDDCLLAMRRNIGGALV